VHDVPVGSFAEGRQRAWERALGNLNRHPRFYRASLVFLVAAAAMNVGLLLANLVRGQWLSAVGSALVSLLVLWLAGTYRALVRRVPEPPRYWLWYQRQP
jgi:hypothetical protein